MNKFLFLLGISISAHAVTVPLSDFDQSKLESLLRSIPRAQVKTEKHEDFLRKFYQFPGTKVAPFSIKCHADHYNGSSIPSTKVCDLDLGDKFESKGDELLLTLTDAKLASVLYTAISYGQPNKKLYSAERVYGQAADGRYRELFRYLIDCSKESCAISFTAKAKTP